MKKGTTSPSIELALILHINEGMTMREACEKAGCKLSGLRNAKRIHKQRIIAMRGK